MFMSGMKTPGVYIVETNDFSRSVVEVLLCRTCFCVGYTERANHDNQSLLNKPWRITSLAEFHRFLEGSLSTVSITALSEDSAKSLLLGSMIKSTGWNKQAKDTSCMPVCSCFYAMGGDVCYVVSVGDYQTSISQDG
jgi:phage tail sheath protein FI